MTRTGATAIILGLSATLMAQQKEWPVHDMERPVPSVVDPGPGPEQPLPVPSDAIVLFDGKDLSAWQTQKGQPAKWKIENGYAEVVKGGGSIATKRAFGDVQLHIEWMSPANVRGEGQNRGNSGVFFGGRYEVQVLDSYNNRTYADGQAAALYGQFPPLVNASRKPGQWQTYDIVYHRPRFEGDKVVSPARVTVIHNGVLVQDDTALMGPTAHKARPPYKPHEDKLPIGLQDHSEPVRFRNIWVRDLEK
jgi:hypothetical protein